jgi:hypothetical protein
VRSQFFETVEKFFILILIAGSVAAISGCAKSQEKESAPANVYTFDTTHQLEEAVKDYALSCDGPCPESSGAILIKEDLRLTSCSMALIGNDILITNRHCIPEALAKAGRSCAGSIRAFFAKGEGTTAVTEGYDCKRVLSVPSEYNDDIIEQRDYAFLQLAKSPSRTALKIGTNGLRDGQKLTAIVATPDHTKKVPASRLEQVVCKTHMNSVVDARFTTPYSPVAVFRDCNITTGNSGSAMVDETGAVKAIVQAAAIWEENERPDPTTFFGKRRMILKNGKFAIGTNAVCMDSAEASLSSSANGCNFKSPLYEIDTVKLGFDEEAERAFANSKAEALNDTIASLHFETVLKLPKPEESQTTGETLSYAIQPVCLNGAAKSTPWLQAYGKNTSGKWVYPSVAPLNYTGVRIRYLSDLDKDARYLFKKVVEESNVALALPAQKIAQGLKGPFKLQGTSTTQGGTRRPVTTNVNFDLPFCQ